jgi:hypothetical protein
LSELGSDAAAWARAHAACFELTPLEEQVDGRRVQVGYTVMLYASMPLAKGPGEGRQADTAKVWGGLREVLQSLVPKEGSRARLEIDAPRGAAFFRPENEMRPEIGLSARLFHADDYFSEVTADERDRLSAVTKRLTDLGLKQGHW